MSNHVEPLLPFSLTFSQYFFFYIFSILTDREREDQFGNQPATDRISFRIGSTQIERGFFRFESS
jgi:hypothetical protein